MELDKAIKERHSVRNFKKNKNISYKKIIEVVDAASKCPLAGNVPCLKYIIVSEKEKIKELREACQQDFIADVEWLIVICSDPKFLEKEFYERGKIYSRQQAGAAIENMLLKITDLGLASCWVGAFSDETVRRILAIPENINLEAILPVGYEMGKTKQPNKPHLDSLIYFNKWKNENLEPKKVTPGFKT